MAPSSYYYTNQKHLYETSRLEYTPFLALSIHARVLSSSPSLSRTLLLEIAVGALGRACGRLIGPVLQWFLWPVFTYIDP